MYVFPVLYTFCNVLATSCILKARSKFVLFYIKTLGNKVKRTVMLLGGKPVQRNYRHFFQDIKTKSRFYGLIEVRFTLLRSKQVQLSYLLLFQDFKQKSGFKDLIKVKLLVKIYLIKIIFGLKVAINQVMTKKKLFRVFLQIYIQCFNT